MKVGAEFFSCAMLIKIGSYLWYITDNTNHLMRVHLKSGIVECMGIIPSSMNNPGRFSTLYYIDNKIYIFPNYGDEFYKTLEATAKYMETSNR